MSLAAPPRKVPLTGATGLIGGLLLADVTHFGKVDDLAHVCADSRRPETLTKRRLWLFSERASFGGGLSWRGVPPMAERTGAASITTRTRRLDSI